MTSSVPVQHNRHVCRGGSNIARRAVAAGQCDLGRERFRAGVRGARFRLYWARLPQRRCAWGAWRRTVE